MLIIKWLQSIQSGAMQAKCKIAIGICNILFVCLKHVGQNRSLPSFPYWPEVIKMDFFKKSS